MDTSHTLFQCNLSRIAPFKPCKSCPRAKPHATTEPVHKADDGDYMATDRLLCLHNRRVYVRLVEVRNELP